MVEKRKINTLYFGQDTETYQILNSNPNLNIVGVSLFDDLVNFHSLNLADYIFKKIYLGFIQKTSVNPTILSIYKLCLQYFTSLPFKKINRYILSVIENKHRILDTTNTQELLKQMSDLHIELIVINSWWILPKEIVEAPKYGTINVHPSKLPQYRGSVPTLWSLKNGDSSSAVTFMKLDVGMDTGNILTQIPFEINKNDSSIDLELKILEIVRKNLNPTINAYLFNDLQSTKQCGTPSKTARYYEYMEIKWPEEKAIDIVNKINLYPYLWPKDKCYFMLKNKKIECTASEHIPYYKKNIQIGEYIINFPEIIFKTNTEFVKFKLFKDISFRDSIYLINNKL